MLPAVCNRGRVADRVYVVSITAELVGLLVFAHDFGLIGSWH